MSSKVQKNHRDLYKARTPPWKETYRKRCLERLKESREKLRDRFRKIHADSPLASQDSFIEELMKEELRKLRQEHSRDQDSGNDLMAESLDLVNIDEVLDLFEDIQADLRKEEDKMLEEMERYEFSLVQEEQSLCSAIEKLCTEEVVCPICQRYPLLSNKSVIFCKCGLRIDTEQDCLTLSNVKQMLETGIKQHEEACDCPPVFSMMSGGATENLIMSCTQCDWMSVVI